MRGVKSYAGVLVSSTSNKNGIAQRHVLEFISRARQLLCPQLRRDLPTDGAVPGVLTRCLLLVFQHSARFRKAVLSVLTIAVG